MSKADDLLVALQHNLGEWTCAFCGSNSNQSAAIFREVKNQGYVFEEVSPNRWAKSEFCPVCGEHRTHYKLLKMEPEFAAKERITIDPATRKRIITLLDRSDAFTGASIASTPEIDHKVPWTRLDKDIDARLLSDNEIKNSFQLLTREHNLLKDRMCDYCKKNNIRPPFFEIAFWYEGDCHYNNSCVGCGWHDGAAWRKALNNKVR